MKPLKLIAHLFFILLLTGLTQVGGLIWVISIYISHKTKRKKRMVFPLLYLVFNLFIIPPLAKTFGRAPLPVFNNELKPRNWVYPLFFRNYVDPKLKNELKSSARILYKSGISITYLDANFPFLDNFPLLPHLSHNDGKKIDISFAYLDQTGKSTDKKPSVSGYGVYANTKDNYTLKSCVDKGYWQYDFSKYLTFGKIHDLVLDKNKTTCLILELLHNTETEKILIEPHLKVSLGLSHAHKLRFQGCRAVRHDDHIHLQIK